MERRGGGRGRKEDEGTSTTPTPSTLSIRFILSIHLSTHKSIKYTGSVLKEDAKNVGRETQRVAWDAKNVKSPSCTRIGC